MRSTRARRTSGMLSNSRTFLADSELASMYLPSIHKEPLLQAPCSDLCIAIHLAVSRRYTCGTRFQTHPMPRRPFPCNQSPPCRFLPFHLLCSPARTPTPRPPLWFKGGAHSAWWPHLCRDGRCHRRLCATCDGHHALDTPSVHLCAPSPSGIAGGYFGGSLVTAC